jgi:hypothetical protein
MRSRLNLWKSQLEKHEGVYTYGIQKMEDKKRTAPGQVPPAASHRIRLRIPKAYTELIDNADDDDTIEIDYESLVGSVTIHNVTIRN